MFELIACFLMFILSILSFIFIKIHSDLVYKLHIECDKLEDKIEDKIFKED